MLTFVLTFISHALFDCAIMARFALVIGVMALPWGAYWPQWLWAPWVYVVFSFWPLALAAYLLEYWALWRQAGLPLPASRPD